jgi:flagellin
MQGGIFFMRINNNMAAMNTWRNLTVSGANLSKSLERLSSGNRINKAADDAAGLAVSEKMRSQIRGVNMATRNAQDGVSMVQTAEGGASKIQDMLQRMRELAVQASSETLGTSDREKLDLEFKELAKEINRTSMATKFNDQNLITGSVTAASTTGAASGTVGSPTYQTGAGEDWLGGTAAITGTSTVTVADANYQVIAKSDGSTGYTYQLQKETATPGAYADVSGAVLTVGSTGLTAGAQQLGTSGISINVSVKATTMPTGVQEFVVGTFATSGYSAGTPTAAHGDTASSSFNVAVGPNAGESIAVAFASLNGESLGITGASGVDTLATGGTNGDVNIVTNATGTITTLDAALETVSNARATMGASQNRLENAISMLQTQSENLTAAESRIRDVDMAAEMSQFTKFQVLQQAGTAMLAQANQLPQGIMSLLR